jgi:hypothetical protein
MAGAGAGARAGEAGPIIADAAPALSNRRRARYMRTKL